MENNMTQVVEENIEQIVSIFQEAVERFDKSQICNDSDRELRKYVDKIHTLSDFTIHLQRYGNDTNIEVGNYKIILRCENIEDTELLRQYLLEGQV